MKSHNFLFLKGIGGGRFKVFNVLGRGVDKIEQLRTEGEGDGRN